MKDGAEDGLTDGVEDGLTDGVEDGLTDGVEDSLKDGVEDSLKDGVEDGLGDRVEVGIYDEPIGMIMKYGDNAGSEVDVADEGSGETAEETVEPRAGAGCCASAMAD